MIAEYYTDDYLGNDIQDLYRACNQFIEMLDHGSFEWDTYDTTNMLLILKNYVNKIDI